MKPEAEGESTMAQEEFDPLDLMSKVALLILEARTPDCSVKGRVEGPHCSDSGYQSHKCSYDHLQCTRASRLVEHIDVLWRNGIPLVIDILLFPDCDHGRSEAESLVGGSTVGQEYFILLERWNIQCQLKRHGEWSAGVCGGSMLLQAVKSYLYFSQLSSWLMSKQGRLPCNIAYRLHTPGEEADVMFYQPPELHSFPLGVYSCHGLKVTVEALPRQQSFPVLSCQLEQHSSGRIATCQHDKVQRIGTDRSIAAEGVGGAVTSQPSSTQNSSGSALECASNSLKSDIMLQFDATSSALTHQRELKHLPRAGGGLTRSQTEKEKLMASDCVALKVLREKGIRPLQLTAPASAQSSSPLDLHSPKVLMSVAGGNPARLAKKQLDLTGICHNAQTSRLHGDMDKSHQLLSPMSPLDMHSFLANLQSITAPIPHCSFSMSNPPTTHLIKAEALLGHLGVSDSGESALARADSQFVSARFRKKKALPFGGEASPELTAAVAKTSMCTSASVIPVQCPALSLQTGSTLFLTKLTSDLLNQDTAGNNELQVEVKLGSKGKQAGNRVCTPAKSSQCSDSAYKDILTHSCEQLCDSIDLTLRDLTKIVKSYDMNHTYLTTVDPQKKKQELLLSMSTESKLYLKPDLKSNSSTPLTSSPPRSESEIPSSLNSANSFLSTHSNIVEKAEMDKRPLCETKQEKLVEKITSDFDQGRDHSKSMFIACSTYIEPKQSSGCHPLTSFCRFYLDQPPLAGNIFSCSAEDHNIANTASEDMLLMSTFENCNNMCVSETSMEDPILIEKIGSALTMNKCGATVFVATEDAVKTCTSQHAVGSQVNSQVNTRPSKTSGKDPVEHFGVHVSQQTQSLHEFCCSSLLLSDDDERKCCQNGVLFHKPYLVQKGCEEVKNNCRDLKGSDSSSPVRTKSAPSLDKLSRQATNEINSSEVTRRGRSTLRDKELIYQQDRLRHRLVKSASMMFNSRGALPSQSSPAPIKRRSSGRFDFDETLTNTKAIKNAISMPRLAGLNKDCDDSELQRACMLSTSAPASTNCLLGNFEESMLNGRLEPAGVVEGFTVDIGASGTFCPRHVFLPVTAYFFKISDDNAPSPYLGHINLDSLGKKGYHVPHKGTLQVTLFNPNKTVVKMFVVMYNLEDMPPSCQTVIRQRSVYMPTDLTVGLPAYLRYLIHLRVCSSSSGKIYLHTDIRLIFARNKFELDTNITTYELHSFTDIPSNPKYSQKR